MRAAQNAAFFFRYFPVLAQEAVGMMDEALKMYYAHASMKEIKKATGKSYDQIIHYLDSNKKPRRGKKYEHLKEEIARLKLSGVTAQDIAKKLGCSRKVVLGYIREAGIPTLDINYNHNFFENIDNEEKAYILGYWYADGCNIITKRGHGRSSLVITDLEILEKIAKCIDFKLKLGVRQPENKKHKLQYRLQMSGSTVYENLKKHGCYGRKSYTLELPDHIINHNLIRHIIRGIMDGDGHITKNFKHPAVLIVGTKMVCQQIQQILNKQRIKSRVYRCIEKKTCHAVRIDASWALKFMDWVYEESTIYLKRKHDRYIASKEAQKGKNMKKSYIRPFIEGQERRLVDGKRVDVPLAA